MCWFSKRQSVKHLDSASVILLYNTFEELIFISLTEELFWRFNKISRAAPLTESCFTFKGLHTTNVFLGILCNFLENRFRRALMGYCTTQLTFTCLKSTTICEICSQLAVNASERRHWRRSGVCSVNFYNILHIVEIYSKLVFLLFT